MANIVAELTNSDIQEMASIFNETRAGYPAFSKNLVKLIEISRAKALLSGSERVRTSPENAWHMLVVITLTDKQEGINSITRITSMSVLDDESVTLKMLSSKTGLEVENNFKPKPAPVEGPSSWN